MKSLVIVFVLLMSVSVMAQSPISKGTINLNGNLSFSSQSFENGYGTQNVISLNPQVGYFFVDNISFGLSLSYNRFSVSGASNSDLGIGSSIRYYFALQNVKPFISLGYFYTQSSNSSNDDKLKGNQFSITGGLDYFITKNVAIESIISYDFKNQKLPDSYRAFYKDIEIKSNTIKVGIGINFFIY